MNLKNKTYLKIISVIFLSVLFLPLALFAADQPQWGQLYTNNMISNEKDLPEDFDLASGKI